MARVLVVDDEENLRLVLRTMLRKQGYQVETAESAEAALDKLAQFDPDFILADVRMPGMDGLELCRTLTARGSRATAIVMSAYGSVDLAIEAMKAGAYDYVAKPFKQDEVLLSLRKAEERESLKRENQALREAVQREQRFEEMVGQSEAMGGVFRLIEKAAQHATTVLITGESGVGKELVARALHQRSARSTADFVAVNCGAIPENLIESELFGHRRGAFTDARADKVGLIESAHGGTLFLDEIGELPLALQVKLLRVLQERTVRRLGDTRDIEVDVRVVAATVRDLKHEVEEGRFREDLYYRLFVLPIHVPPLRERKEDIPALTDHFLSRCNGRMGTDVSGVTPNARKFLLQYDWPGNVRELENVLERAVVLADGTLLDVVDLPERLTEKPGPAAQVLASGDLSIKRATRFIEEELIKRALEKTSGNRTAAAKVLEISHRALLYKLKEYGIS